MYGQYIGRGGGGGGVNSLSIVGRLSTLQSVHYRRFHCNVPNANTKHMHLWFISTCVDTGSFEVCMYTYFDVVSSVEDA